MTASPSELLTVFFTRERLAYYRDLHARYPLWCGDWPESERNKPESYRWYPSLRLQSEATKLAPPDACGVFVDFDWPEPHVENVPAPVVRIVAGEPGSSALRESEVDVFDPTAMGAMLSAVALTCALWRPGVGPSGTGEPHVAERPENALEQLRYGFERVLRRPDMRVVGVGGEPGPTGMFILLLRSALLETPREERKARERLAAKLRDHWLWIGEDIGAIPRRQGGAASTLSGDLLDALCAETQELIEDVVEYAPDEREMDDVRVLLLGQRDPFTREQKAILAEKRRRGQADIADYEQSLIEKRDRELKTHEWARRLRFPMLTESDLRLARKKRSSVKAAALMLADYLPLKPKTLENRISELRKT